MLLLFCSVLVYVFFFFKQKTAYEMRISDWSSDVCSSDLIIIPGVSVIERMAGEAMHAADVSVTNDVHVLIDNEQRALLESLLSEKTHAQQSRLSCLREPASRVGGRSLHEIIDKIDLLRSNKYRSEEHTSELQSLMRILYAVVCFNNKTD